MQLRNRFFPYPVIIEGGNYYDGSTFETSVEQSMDGYNVKLHISANLHDDVLLSMIKSGDVVYVHHIECPQTCYRRIKKTDEPIVEYLLKDEDVNGLVQVCSFVVADRDIARYTNDSFSADYRGWRFNIERGCIMAVGSQYNLRVNKQRDDFANTASIFSIVKNTDPDAEAMTIDLGKQKIIITLPESTFNQYSSIQNYVDIQPVMHSMLIIPALVYAFSEIKNAGVNIYEYEENRWFRGLKKACESVGVSLDEKNLNAIDVVKVPQLLLNNPVTRAISFCAIGGGTYED